MKSKITFLIVSLFLVGIQNNTNAQAPNWGWVTDTLIAAGGMTSDISGNVYVSNGFGEDFLVKYANTASVIWKKAAIGAMEAPPAVKGYPNDVALDPAGNILVTGIFTSDSITFGTTSFSRASTVDMFVAKFSPDGNFLWARTEAIGNVGNVGFHIASDAIGNMVVVGSYSAPSLTVGSTSFTNPCTSGGGCPSMLVIKYSMDGNVLWAKSSFAEGGTSYSYSVAIDASNNIYVGGDFLDNRTGIVKYNSIGDTVWTQVNGGWYVTIDGSSNLFSGYDKDVSKATVKGINSSNGSILWTTAPTGNTSNKGISINTDNDGNIYFTGSFRTTPITFGSYTLPHASGAADDDIFIVKYTNTGSVVWAKSLGGNNYDQLKGTTVDGAGNVFVGGVFLSTKLGFDNDTLINAGQVAGIANIFFAKLGDNPIVLPALPNAPTNLTVSPMKTQEAGKMLLTWTDNSNNENGFRIERSNDGNAWLPINSVGMNVTTFVDSGLAGSTTYYYQVVAFNASGTSGFSNSVSATTLATGIKPLKADNLKIRIHPNPATTEINIKGISNITAIEIHDLLGNVVLRKVTSTDVTLPVNKFSPGIYSISIESNNYREVKKVIIK